MAILRNSSALLFFGEVYILTMKTAFYTWMLKKSIRQSPKMISNLSEIGTVDQVVGQLEAEFVCAG